MRTLAAVLVLSLLVGSTAAGSALALGTSDEVTIEGRVTGPDGAPAGDAVVLVGEYGLLTKLSPDELREIAAGDPQDVTVIDVGSDGRFEADVPRKRADAAVALNDAGISEVARLSREDATLSMRLHERRPQTVYAHIGSVSADERRARLYVSLVNNGDAPIENLSVGVTSLPDGWSVADVETGGAYRPESRTLTWPSVAPGAEVDTTVVLTVPADTPPGEYAVELRAESGTHPVSVASATVEVLPEETPGPTETVLPGGDETTATGNATAPTDTTPTSTDVSTPGLGSATAIVALLSLAAALALVRRS